MDIYFRKIYTGISGPKIENSHTHIFRIFPVPLCSNCDFPGAEKNILLFDPAPHCCPGPISLLNNKWYQLSFHDFVYNSFLVLYILNVNFMLYKGFWDYLRKNKLGCFSYLCNNMKLRWCVNTGNNANGLETRHSIVSKLKISWGQEEYSHDCFHC